MTDHTEPLTGRAGLEAEYGYTPPPERERDDEAETYGSDYDGLQDAADDLAERRAEQPDIVERVRGDGRGGRPSSERHR
jgi:hypothetical protein